MNVKKILLQLSKQLNFHISTRKNQEDIKKQIKEEKELVPTGVKEVTQDNFLTFSL